MEEADALCSRVAIIDRGTVLADGTPAKLKRSLGAETVLSLTVSGDVGALRAAAEGLDGVDRAEADGESVRVFARDSDGLLAELVTAATSLGVRVHEASSAPPTLEAVFLALTGRDLRE